MAASASREQRSAAAGAPGLRDDSVDWVKIAASSTLIAGGLLLLAGQRRAALAAAATGTTLAMLDQQEMLRSWWRQLPGYVDQVQDMIRQVQSTVEDFTAKRETLSQALTGTEPQSVTEAEAKAEAES